MKRIAVLVLTLTFVVASLFAAGTPDYTLKVPDGWKKREGSAALEHYMKAGVSMMLTTDYAPAEAKTPDAYVEFVKKLYVKSFKNTQFEPVKKLSVNGNDARELVYTAEVAGMKMKYDVLYVPKDSKYYTLTIGGLAKSFDEVKADCKTIFNSFKFK
jgi:predicted Zn-dependent protease